MVSPYSKKTVVATPFGVTAAANEAVVSVTPEEENELMEGLAVVDAAPVVNRDSKAPCMANPVESVAVSPMRTVWTVLPARLEEGV